VGTTTPKLWIVRSGSTAGCFPPPAARRPSRPAIGRRCGISPHVTNQSRSAYLRGLEGDPSDGARDFVSADVASGLFDPIWYD
jgi:hypothetical protein